MKRRVRQVCLAGLAACWIVFGPNVPWRGSTVSLEYPQAAAADITYIYDALGRLVGVVDPVSDTAVYQYDAVGNLLSISRYASATVSIIDVDPHSGPIGATVTIAGTGFSATPSQNTVTFNGTAASVTASTATQIVTTVPGGATTGPIGVTSPAGSAASSGAFTVSNSLAPTITSFTPGIGTPGTAVTLTGTNFEPVTTNNRLNFNVARAAVGAASATTLGTTVPAAGTSGPLTVATPAGVAQSPGDFFVPPPGYTLAQTVFTGRLTMNGSNVAAPIAPAGKIGLIVFDGSAGQPVSLAVVQVNNYNCSVTIYRPDGATVLSQAIGSGAPARDLHLASLPVAGTYTILVGTSGSDTFTLTLSQDLPPVPIAIGGAAVTLSIVRRAQRAPLTFSGTAGQRLSLGATAAGFASRVTVLTPDGSALISLANLGSPTGALDLPVLPATGTYTIFVDPNNVATGSITLTLSEEVSGAITIGGAAVPVSLTRPGQRARLTFTGTAGQLLDLGLTGSTIPWGAVASILNPDGGTVAWASFGTTPTAVDAYLPAGGTYAVLIDPGGGDIGAVTLTLSEEVSGWITPGGAAVPLNITRAGQRGRLFFNGTAGQRVSVALTGVTLPQYSQYLVKPGGVIQAGPISSAFLDVQTLATTGVYSILLDPAQAYTGSATVTAYDVPANLTGSLTINGPAVTTTLTAPGQQASFTFPATAGQAITARGASSTIGCTNLFLTTPSGSTSSSSPCTASWSMSHTPSQNGTFTFRIDPTSANVGSVDVSVTSP